MQKYLSERPILPSAVILTEFSPGKYSGTSRLGLDAIAHPDLTRVSLHLREQQVSTTSSSSCIQPPFPASWADGGSGNYLSPQTSMQRAVCETGEPLWLRPGPRPGLEVPHVSHRYVPAHWALPVTLWEEQQWRRARGLPGEFSVFPQISLWALGLQTRGQESWLCRGWLG